MGAYDLPADEIKLIQQVRTGIKLGWKIEDVKEAGAGRRNLTFLAGKLPPLDQRPLAFLDYMIIAYPYTAAAIGIDEKMREEYLVLPF